MRASLTDPRLVPIRSLFGSLLLLPLLLAAGGCSSLSSVDDSQMSCPETGCFADAAVDNTVPVADVTTPPADAAETKKHPFCGTGCDPDNDAICKSYVPPDAGVQDAAKQDAADGGADASSAFSDGGEIDSDASKSAEDAASGNMGAYGASGKEPDNGGEPEENLPEFGCRVSWETSGATATCNAAGSGKAKDPCLTSEDCAAGFACVGTVAPQCLHYCCQGNINCVSGYYCSEEIAADYLADHPSANPSELQRVPVCVPARNCDPIDPEHDPNACDKGLACAIVRSDDGTTGCVALPSDAPGEGGSCKDVSCAQGFVCAKATNTCMKLCHVASTADECAGGVCQGGSTNLPEGLGICVGASDK